MAEKEQQASYPLAPVNGYSRSDEEAAESKRLKRQKRTKCFLYILAFIVFQIGVITLFTMTIMKFRTPKFRIRSTTLQPPPNVTTTSFNIMMDLQLGVKNTNFGPFKYQNTTIDFYYKDTKVGEVFILQSKANLRATKKVTVPVTLSSTAITTSSLLSELTSDYTAGNLYFSIRSKMRGKVTIMFIMKKNRSPNLNCTMQFTIASSQLQTSCN